MLTDSNDPGVSKEIRMLHGWQQETPEIIAQFWFADDIPKITKSVVRVGALHGHRTGISFFRKPRETDDNRHETLVVLEVDDDLLVPFIVTIDLRWADEFDEQGFSALILKRLREVMRAKYALRRRAGSAARALEVGLKKVGHGISLERFVFEPTRLSEAPGRSNTRPFTVAFNERGNDLRFRSVEYFFGGPRGMAVFLGWSKLIQARRAEAIKQRSANPGKIEIDTIALHLLKRTDINPADVAALDDGLCIPAASPISFDGAILTDLQFFLSNGRIAARFDFDGGYYDTGRIILHDTVRESIQESLIGKRLNQVIAGGIFDVFDVKISARDEMTSGTSFRLEPQSEWIPCEFKDS